MSHRAVICVLCWLAIHSTAVACLNTYGTDLQGHATWLDEPLTDLADRLRGVEINRSYWENVERSLSHGLESADFQQRSDYAVALIYLGKYEDAISLLEEIERQQPGEYIVATNLGTAYELSGELDRALVWIQAGFERNPDAHAGSEWLHVKILEARLKLAEDPDWLKAHTVLGLDFGQEAAPKPPNAGFVDSRGKAYDLESVAQAIEYQLHERLQFVRAPDPVVASLLFDRGNVLSLTNVVEQALPVYDLAREFGVPDESLLDRRASHFQALASANPQSGKMVGDLSLDDLKVPAVILFGLLMLSLAGCLVCWRIVRRKAAPS